MRRFVVEIVCENDAFQGETGQYEVAGILRDVAGQVADGFNLIYLTDSNGNSCGVAQYTGE